MKSIVGVDTVLKDGIKWRGKGLLKALSSHWEIAYLDANLLIIRFEKSALTPAGVDILVRECTEIKDLEGKDTLETYGLSKAECRSLTWF